MRLKKMEIWILLLLFVVHVAIGYIQENSKQVKVVTYIEMDDLPTRLATFITKTVFATKYSTHSDKKPLAMVRNSILHIELLVAAAEPIPLWMAELDKVFVDPLLIARLPYERKETQTINPISLILPAGYYTTTSNYRFHYLVVSGDRTKILEDVAFLTQDKLFLKGLFQKLEESDVGAPVYARDEFSNLGLVGIVVEIRIDGIFAMKEVGTLFDKIVALGDYRLKMATSVSNERIRSLADYVPENKFQVPIIISGMKKHIFCTFVTYTAALTYYIGKVSYATTIIFLFDWLNSRDQPVEKRLYDMGLFREKDVMMIVLPKDFTVYTKQLQPISLNMQSYAHGQSNRDNFYFYINLDTDGDRKSYLNLVGDTIFKPGSNDDYANNQESPNNYDYCYRDFLAGYILKAENEDVGSSMIRKNVHGQISLMGMMKEVDKMGRFRVAGVDKTDTVTHTIIWFTQSQEPAPERFYIRNLINMLLDDQDIYANGVRKYMLDIFVAIRERAMGGFVMTEGLKLMIALIKNVMKGEKYALHEDLNKALEKLGMFFYLYDK